MSTKCPRGIILTTDETGKNPVPFLVAARSKDIIWDKENIKKVENSIQNTHLADSQILRVNPEPSYRFYWDGWLCNIESDGYAVCTKVLDITDEFVLDNFNSITQHNIQFPQQFIRIPAIQLTKQVRLGEERISDVFVSQVNKNELLYTSFDLTIQSSVYKIPPSFVSAFEGCKINITVTGLMNVL